MIEKILTYLEVEKRYTDLDSKNMMVKNYVPNVTGLSAKDAIAALKEQGFSYTLVDADENGDLSQIMIAEQIPRYNSYVMSGSKVVLYTNSETVKQTVTVPNLIGYTLTEAIETLTDLGLNVQANNIGNVVSQSIQDGTVVNKGSVIKLDLMNNDTEAAD